MKTFLSWNRTLLKGKIYKPEYPFSKFTEIFQGILHAPLKSKQVRGKDTPFINNELSKVINNKSGLRNKYLKCTYRKNFLAYKKMKNKCNTLTRKTKNWYFEYIGKNKNFATSKASWNTVNHFMCKKCKV